MMNKKAIVLYGGQFNPIHTAHLLVANEVYHQLKPDKFYFLPSYMAPLKTHDDYLDAKYRIKMIQLAIEELGFGEICQIELERKGQSYTYETLKDIVNNEKDADIYFIIGTDQYKQLDKWYKIEKLKQLITFVIVNRDVNYQEVDESMISVNIPRMDISSSLIRNRVKNKQPINILVPRSIHDYIREEGFYEN
ncbi:nicotinate-nucleotide adenylyltransferase [Staphylococcus sp. EG-SA-6]|jgi:nicotinate-nucleotide adenylyltransferase|uniref:Probable nicotinate-nucleotide adenylyltransferase n=3 Tax=Bacilli TaxID=91061 RepID=NADD_STAHJ|nr:MULTISPECIES: nicotinate-nucleotide adenylyltransferase [Staphylococcus]Q4L6U5.1 RecName: Full=Probable nicotinate-nucleotide adenylyltransferase; AltName: Full=Deamido-NAD(+) diphosphorylase; AltName: Full=Deamido-NAD(+) pyrophosphorylase; AltName: Full=Nicotinate mononucleotide adenylyltransferase; Short=NaMN adenylyltransferase [Staphylococcus haemolyticus JCSC1435]KDP53781.1 nicotinate-nucleotide adenylyltransferase [Staphylococcus aureus subsp. aureus CO-98]MBN4935643.1 nicotinate-nucleo